jgi:hypothetical protein
VAERLGNSGISFLFDKGSYMAFIFCACLFWFDKKRKSSANKG